MFRRLLMTYEKPLKIEIPVEEDPPLKPENSGSTAKDTAYDAGKQVKGLAKESAQRAWESDTRRKITDKVNKEFDARAAKGTQYLRDKIAETAETQTREQVTAVQSKLREVDWQTEARTGISTGLKWLSKQVQDLSERVNKDDS
jgi:hypothetical protein